jgi:hypothetical protein
MVHISTLQLLLTTVQSVVYSLFVQAVSQILNKKLKKFMALIHGHSDLTIIKYPEKKLSKLN